MTNTQKETLIKLAYEKETERLEKSMANRALVMAVGAWSFLLVEVIYSYDILPVGFLVTVIVFEGICFVFALAGIIVERKMMKHIREDANDRDIEIREQQDCYCVQFLRDPYKVYVEKENLR